MSLLITHATVLTVDAEDRVIDDGAVFVEDGRIAAVGPSAEVEAAHPDAARVVDGTGKVVLPGFVSTHNHVGYTFFRGRAEDMGLGCVTGQYFPFEVLRACVTMARIKTGNPTVMQCPEALRLATIAGAEALGMGDEIGSVESGKRADLQMLDYRRFGLTPTLDPVQNLVYHAHSKDVELVMVDGNILVEDFELKTADARSLIDDAGAAAEAAWGRFVAKYGDTMAR